MCIEPYWIGATAALPTESTALKYLESEMESLMRGVKNLLGKDVMEILNTPIHIPYFSWSARRTRSSRAVEQVARRDLVEGTLHAGTSADYTVGGIDFNLHEDTWVFGELQYGARAQVRLGRDERGELFAVRITMLRE